MKKIYLKFILFTFVASFYCIISDAQLVIKGHVTSDDGKPIEFVTVWMQADSVGTISDANGDFTLQLSKPCKGNIELTHVAYNRTILPYIEWSNKKFFTVTMRERSVKLPEICVPKKNRAKLISGDGMRGPGVIQFVHKSGKDNNELLEVGQIFKVHKNYILSAFNFEVMASTIDETILNINFYELEDGKLTNILTKPIYYKLYKSSQKTFVSITPDEEIRFNQGHKYWVSLRAVKASNSGAISFPTRICSNLIRVINTGKKKHFPGGLGFNVYGTVVNIKNIEH